MLSLLDVVNCMKDKESALTFLRSVPKPFRSQDVRLASGYDLNLSSSDVVALLNSKRPDLAELILERTTDMNVLYEISRMDVTSSIMRAICRNYHVPAPLLLDIHLDSRKTVQGAARSALGRYVSVTLPEVDSYSEVLRDILYCPEEDLLTALTLVNQWRYRSAEAALSLVFERPGGISNEVRGMLFSASHDKVARNPNGALARALTADPRTTVDEINMILSRVPAYSSRIVLQKALLDRLEANSQEWLDVLLEYSEYDAKSHAKYTSQLSREKALVLLAQGGPPAEKALQSSKLEDADVIGFVVDWVASAQTSPHKRVPMTASVLSHRSIRGELLDNIMEIAALSPDTRVALAANPNLSVEQQLSMVKEDSTRRELARNPAISREAAEAVRDVVLPTTDSNRGVLSWSTQTVLTSLIGNPNVPFDVLGQLPISVARSVRGDISLTSRAVAGVINNYLQGEPAKWRMFLDLMPEWEGSLRDLCLAVETL